MMIPVSRRLIFAHYFLWFGSPARSGDWGNWAWDGPGPARRPDVIRNGRRDIAAVQYPALEPYDSSDESVMRRHILWAKRAGIDFFTVDWYGPPGHEGSTPKYARVDRNFSALLSVGARNRFKAAVCYEEKLLFERLGKTAKPADRIRTGIRHLRYAMSTYAGHPGYMRVGERPVLIVWGDHSLTNEEWESILKPVRNEYNPVVIYSYFFKSDKRQYDWYRGVCGGRPAKPAVDGMYPWLLLGSRATIRRRLTAQYRRLNEMKRLGIIDIVAGSVWPGFDDTGVRAWGAAKPRVIRDTRGLYEMTWDFALRHRADWISIATWNDWNEGSQIEPDADRGERLLDITARYARKFK